MPTNEDDMEETYQKILIQINKEVIQYTLSLIQDAGLEVDNLRDFMKGYYISKFVWMLNTIHVVHGNLPKDNETIFQEYLKKISSSEKLKELLDELL